MFTITIYPRPGKLENVLAALDGLIIGEPLIRPVKGATVDNDGNIKSTQLVPGGSMPVNLAAAILATKKRQITSQEMKQLIASVGGTPAGLSYYATALRKAGVLGKLKWNRPGNRTLGGVYQVLKRKK